jgi:signal peptidase I
MELDPLERPVTTKKSSTVARGVAELTRTILLAAIVFVGARTVVLPYEVDGASMKPNLHDQERVLVNRTVYFHFDLNRLVNWIPGVDREGQNEIFPFHPPERGDVVVLNPPLASSQPYIKRIIGLPGESIEFRAGYVYVNGKRLDEPYIDGAITRCNGSSYCSIDKIPDGYVYVLGDNRDNSSDSRSFGLVKIEDIVGKAWFTNWPLTDVGLVPHYDYHE